jgi:hypothetical protein
VLTGLWLAISSPSLAADWVRYRVLAMLLTAVLLVWSTGRVASLIWASPDASSSAGIAAGEVATDVTGAAPEVAGRAPTREGSRPDLFKVPHTRKPTPRQEPKTNPVDLLALIELQGVLGGSHPRAMIQYKRTQEAVTVSVGDDLGEFKVMEIRERSVVLKWREELFELSL